MKFSNVLLVLGNRSRRAPALRRAAEFARNTGAKLGICEVINWVDRDYSGYMTRETSRRLLDTFVAQRTAQLSQLIESCDLGDLQTEVFVLAGKPHVEIARLVHANRHDLVIRAVDNRRGIRHLADRRDDRDLIRNCPCPVWLLNSADQDERGCILVALDMPSDGGTDSELNQSVLRIAKSIAIAESRSLHVVHAWRLPGEGRVRARGVLATDMEADRMVVREVSRRSGWLRHAVNTVFDGLPQSGAEDVAPELHLIRGRAKNAIPDLAEKLGAELIVVGTVDRTGVSGVIHGNTSEKIMPRSDRSLLIVKRPTDVSLAAVVFSGKQRESELSAPEWREIGRGATHAATSSRDASNAR